MMGSNTVTLITKCSKLNWFCYNTNVKKAGNIVHIGYDKKNSVGNFTFMQTIDTGTPSMNTNVQVNARCTIGQGKCNHNKIQHGFKKQHRLFTLHSCWDKGCINRPGMHPYTGRYDNSNPGTGGKTPTWGLLWRGHIGFLAGRMAQRDSFAAFPPSGEQWLGALTVNEVIPLPIYYCYCPLATHHMCDISLKLKQL